MTDVKKQPLVKRATKNKSSTDPFDDFFSSTLPPTQKSKRATSAASASSAAGTDNPDTEMAPPPQPSNAGPSTITDRGGLNPRLKKRAGTSTSVDFMFGGDKDQDADFATESQRKRMKLDAIYESQARASATQQAASQEMQEQAQPSVPQKRRQEKGESPEVAEARKRVKRREQDELKAQKLREAEKAKGNEPQRTSAKDEEAARLKEAEAKYLQADTTSKRKQKDANELTFAKEFNAVSTVATEKAPLRALTSTSFSSRSSDPL